MSARTRRRRSSGHLVVRGPTRPHGSQRCARRCASPARVGAPDAAYHRAALEQFGVDTWLTCDDAVATGTIVVLVSPDGERSMFTDRGANRGLRAADLPARLLDDARLLHVSGYQLFEPGTRSAVRHLWATALEAGVPTSVDPASVAGLREVGRQSFLEWTSGAQIVFPNLDEGRLLTGRDQPEAIVADAARDLSGGRAQARCGRCARRRSRRAAGSRWPLSRRRSWTPPVPETRSAPASSRRGCAAVIWASVP